MKTLITTLLIITSLTSLAGNMIEKPVNTFYESIESSEIIFSVQCAVNPVLDQSGKDYLNMDEVKNIIGEKKFNDFYNAILFLMHNDSYFSEIRGDNETNTNFIYNLKYGKRFYNIPTYVKTGDSYKLFSYREKINLTAQIRYVAI